MNASTLVGQSMIQELSDGTVVTHGQGCPQVLSGVLNDLQHPGYHFKTVSFNSWKFAGSEVHIKEFLASS